MLLRRATWHNPECTHLNSAMHKQCLLRLELGMAAETVELGMAAETVELGMAADSLMWFRTHLLL